ncbi:MAG: hypothetical protein N2509_05990, partial [Treponemataceae bacterium]|nr:hypothetical protein [Treponemataceae bacterium]
MCIRDRHSLAQEDLSWIANYGTDVIRHNREIHRILEDTYRGLYHKKKVLRQWPFIEWVKERYHHYAFALLSIRAAHDYAVQGQTLDANKTYYDAFSDDYPGRALAYLKAAQEEEVAKIPGSLPNYLLEEGIVRKDAARIEAALNALDPLWQRDLIQDGLVKLYGLYRRQWAFSRARQIAEDLYALNPGYLLQHGIRLPLRIVFPEDDSGDAQAQGTTQKSREREFIQRSLVKLIKRSNVEVREDMQVPARFTLFLRPRGSSIECSLVDALKGTTLQTKTLPFSLSRKDPLGTLIFTASEKEALLAFLFTVPW